MRTSVFTKAIKLTSLFNSDASSVVINCDSNQTNYVNSTINNINAIKDRNAVSIYLLICSKLILNEYFHAS